MSLSRRTLLRRGLRSAMALSLRSAITGLPLPFLLSGRASATPVGAKSTILLCSGSGEAANVHGPGTFEPEVEHLFSHLTASEAGSDVGSAVVSGSVVTADHLELGAPVQLGAQVETMAAAFGLYPAEMRQHLCYFQHRTEAGIHPQYPTVLACNGRLNGQQGNGADQLPAAIAQEISPLLGSATTTPFIVSGGGRFTDAGKPLPSYTPLQTKQLANSVGNVYGGPENFGVLYDHFIDESYAQVKTEGTPQQKRYFDDYASSRIQAKSFGQELGQLLVDIEDDSIESQLRVAIMLCSLNLAPVVVTAYSFGGDNHSDSTLTVEAQRSLETLQALDTYFHLSKAMGTFDTTILATSTVFGRRFQRGANAGRGHNGKFCSGLLVGGSMQGGIIGGIDTAGDRAVSTGLNSVTGGPTEPDVTPENTLDSYYRSIMMLAGIPEDRRQARLPHGKDVLPLLG